MALTNKELKNLVGGVSQQADSIRKDIQCTSQVNFLSDPVRGLVKRPGTSTTGLIASTIDYAYASGDKNVFTHQIIRDGDTKLLLAIGNGKLSLTNILTGDKIRINDSTGTEINYNAAQTYLNYSGTYDTHPYAAVTIADHTFVLNKEKVPVMQAGQSHNDATYNKRWISRGTAFIKEGAYNAEYTVIATDSDGTTRTLTVKTSDGLGSGNVVDSKTDNICAAIHAGLNSAAATRTNSIFNIANYGAGFADEDTGITITYAADVGTGVFNQGAGATTVFNRTGSVFQWRCQHADYDTKVLASNKLSLSDSYGNTMTSVFTDIADSFLGLPLEGVNNYLLKIEGNPESDIDDYFVEFVLDDTNAGLNDKGSGRWQETLDATQTYIIDGTYMPHILVKESEFVYMFKEAEWDNKTVGDNTTDAQPNFIGTPIRDLFFFKSRLGFLSGENVTLTELDDPFNFWRTTVTQVLSSDRIDISSSVNQVTILNYAVPFANQMVIFSDNTQFIINYGQQGLNPQTAALAQIASYEASTSVRPIAIDTNIIFAQDRSDSTALYEMFPTGTTELSFEAQDITEQVPSYINGRVIRMVGSSLAGAILIQTDTSDNSLYCYKFFNRGRERILSSWFKYTFPCDMIKGLHYIGDTCYKVNELEDLGSPGTYIHNIDEFKMDNTETITWSADQIVMDGLARITQFYNSGTDETELSFGVAQAGVFAHWPKYFPYANIVAFDDTNAIYAKRIASVYDGKVYLQGDVTSAITANGVNVAVTFDAEYEFSKQYLKRADAFGKEKALVDGRTTIKWVEVYLTNSQYMELEVSYPGMNRTTTTKTFSGNVVGSIIVGDQASETGTLRSIVGARNDIPVIKLQSTTIQTATITGASFEIAYTSRLRGRN